jgi:hypothetical protein
MSDIGQTVIIAGSLAFENLLSKTEDDRAPCSLDRMPTYESPIVLLCRNFVQKYVFLTVVTVKQASEHRNVLGIS